MPCAPTYSELVSTGRLSDLRDPALRDALTSYGDAHAQITRVYSGGVQIVFDPASNYYRAVDWRVEPETWETNDAILAYDWEMLRASRAEMQAWLPFQHDLTVYGGRELATVRRILAILGENGR